MFCELNAIALDAVGWAAEGCKFHTSPQMYDLLVHFPPQVSLPLQSVLNGGMFPLPSESMHLLPSVLLVPELWQWLPWPCFEGQGWRDSVSSMFFLTHMQRQIITASACNSSSLTCWAWCGIRSVICRLQTRPCNEPCYFAPQEGIMKFSSGCCVLVWHVYCYTRKMISAGEMWRRAEHKNVW